MPCTPSPARRHTTVAALLPGAPDGDAEAEENGDGHHHLDHDLRLVAQAAEGAPVRSDPADDGVDVSLVGRKEHVSHRPWWVVPVPQSPAGAEVRLILA